MTLSDCRPGHEVRLRRVGASAGGHGARLAELGFLRGARIRVIARGTAGGVVVALGDARVALDASTCGSLLVEPVAPPGVSAVVVRRRPRPRCAAGGCLVAQPLPVAVATDASSTTVARIALVGAPNVGKSTLFNALTGASEHVGNWPGKTVAPSVGSWPTSGGTIELIDLPGACSLLPRSPEEAVVRDMLVHRDADQPDLVIVVIDAANLARGLYLLAQVLDTAVPVVVALAMLDVAAGRGLRVGPEALSEHLGVPVVAVQPRSGVGLDRLATAVTRALEAPAAAVPPSLGAPIEAALSRLATVAARADAGRISPRWLAMALLSGRAGVNVPEQTAALLRQLAPAAAAARLEVAELLADRAAGTDTRRADNDRPTTGEPDTAEPDVAGHGHVDLGVVIAERRHAWAHEVVAVCVRRPARTRSTISDRLDRVLVSPWTGIPVFLAVMWATFVATTRLAAPLQDLLARLVEGPATTAAHQVLTLVRLDDTWVDGLVVDGLVAGVGQLLTFIPLMAIMFVLLAVLEDSGYLARAAFVADRFLRLLGLPGQAFLPLIVGFGCNVPAIAGTRILADARHRRLTALLVPLVSCSARLTVYLLLANAFFGEAAGTVVFTMYLLSVTLVILLGVALRHTMFRHQRRAPLVLDLPPYRLPSVPLVARQVGRKLAEFLGTAGGIIVAAVVAVWLLMAIPLGPGAGGFGRVQVSDSLYGGLTRAGAVVFVPAGFADSHATGALVTGLVAKEAVVSTFAQTYRTGEADDAHRPGDLDEHLRATFERTSDGHPIPAVLAFLVFLLAYTPCLATAAAQRAEIGTRWTLLGLGLQLTIAWILAVTVYQIGRHIA